MAREKYENRNELKLVLNARVNVGNHFNTRRTAELTVNYCTLVSDHENEEGKMTARQPLRREVYRYRYIRSIRLFRRVFFFFFLVRTTKKSQ